MRFGLFLLTVILILLSISRAKADQLLPEEKIYGLSLIWQEANYNFAFFDQVPELDWDNAYKSYIPKVIAAESKFEYYRVLQRFTAQLQDAHTLVRFPGDLLESRIWSYPWILIKRVNDQAYVSNVGKSMKHQLPVGSVITRINGTPAADYIRHEVVPYISSSTEHFLLDQAYRNSLHGHADASVTIDFIRPDKKSDSISLLRDRWSREDQWEPDPNIQKPRFSVSWPEPNIALVEINSFENKAISDEWIKALPEIRQASALIIDIRRNPGGNSNIGWTIAGWLTDLPLLTSTWRTREHRAAHKAWGLLGIPGNEDWARMNSWHIGSDPRTIQPAEGDRLIMPVAVLQDHATGSAAEDFLVAIESVPHITLIGRPSSGSTGQPLFIDLPGGGTAIICTKRDTFPDGRDFVGIGIEPDIFVEETTDDVFHQRDVILEKALLHLKSQIAD